MFPSDAKPKALRCLPHPPTIVRHLGVGQAEMGEGVIDCIGEGRKRRRHSAIRRHPWHRSDGVVQQLADRIVCCNSGYGPGPIRPHAWQHGARRHSCPHGARSKAKFLSPVLQQDFDIPGMARFVLGPYWRVASEPEKQEFSQLFEDYIVRIYSQRFAPSHGEALEVTGSRSGPEGAIVTSEIVRPAGGRPIKVEWRLGTRDGLYKVDDVIIDGVSMGASERTEFASLIQRGGGQVQGLLAMMRDRAAAPTSTRQAAPAPNPGTSLHRAEPALSFASAACGEADGLIRPAPARRLISSPGPTERAMISAIS